MGVRPGERGGSGPNETPVRDEAYEQDLEGAVASIAGVTGGAPFGTDGNVATLRRNS